MTGYKRASIRFDLWAYDNSTATPTQDYVEYAAFVNSDVGRRRSWTIGATTSGWTTVVEDLSHAEPMKSDYRVEFVAYDTGTDNIVEFVIDNVVVEGSKQICTALGVDAPPNGVGDSVRIGKTGANAAVSWTASAIDATHDGAAYYELFVSGAPSGGFAVADTAAETSTLQPLAGPSSYYLVSAVNASGTSGDEPAP